MVGRAYPEPPQNESYSLASIYGAIYVLGIIPLWHRLNLIQPSTKLPEWAKTLKSYGYFDPDRLARTILWLVDLVCLLGFVGAVIWIVIHFQERRRWAVLPALWLSGTMLLFQNLTAHFFFYPVRPKYINLHYVFWAIFALMLLYAFFARPRPVEAAAGSSDEPEARFAALGWLAAAVAAMGIVVLLAGYVNNEKTMQTANTRWPVWAWPDGPFPGRRAKP